ncbi:hypothetical protein [Desulfosarcina alkanivorans]|uniref:hypothetical protein n=1 Tax=Desulfosarcina alkanivorans TaxID=571177 RepID=UPI0012D33C7E|nr:hypothetical protein [Desulfosarcina alkanivorans]
MNDEGAGIRFLRLLPVCLHPERSVFGYPKIPQPNAAVQIMEKATTMIIHMSSFFI